MKRLKIRSTGPLAAALLLTSVVAIGEDARWTPVQVDIANLPTMRVTMHGRGIPPTVEWIPARSAPEGGIAGCTQVASHTTASFTGGSYVAQLGFAEQEYLANSYTLSAGDFPAKMELAEFIFVTSGASVQTTTQYSILFWNGLPSTGQQVASFSSDNTGAELPPIVLGPGTNGVNVQVSIDPGDADQVIFTDDGTHTISFGVRIDHHNNQTQNACLVAPPTGSNAFPCTDTGGLQYPADNWLNGLNCGSFGCPANGGWARFSALNQLCRPSGDWVMRLSYSQSDCTAGFGACCLPDGFCETQFAVDCAGSGFTYLGDGSSCNGATCVPHRGACCLPGGSCEIRLVSDCATAGLTYRGDDTECAGANCPQPTGACCFAASGGCLNNFTSANCTGAGGIWHGAGSTCATTVCFPRGACCLPNGSCSANVSPETCAGQSGNFQGNNTTCASVNCPPPLGACCFSTTFCLNLSSSDCATAGASWHGIGSACETGSPCAVPTCKRGDANCDGTINNFDVDPFVAAILHAGESQAPAEYLAGGATQQCWDQRGCWGDVSRSNSFDNFDIDPFVACIVSLPPTGNECP